MNKHIHRSIWNRTREASVPAVEGYALRLREHLSDQVPPSWIKPSRTNRVCLTKMPQRQTYINSKKLLYAPLKLHDQVNGSWGSALEHLSESDSIRLETIQLMCPQAYKWFFFHSSTYLDFFLIIRVTYCDMSTHCLVTQQRLRNPLLNTSRPNTLRNSRGSAVYSVPFRAAVAWRPCRAVPSRTAPQRFQGNDL
jgi:hypothetical protein